LRPSLTDTLAKGVSSQSLFANLLLAFALPQTAQAQQPFERFGVEVKVLTLSNGRYPEFFDNDSLRRIGSVVYDTRLHRVAYLLPPDSLVGRPKPEVTSRWLSLDPLAAKYPGISPYAYVANNPVIYVDPDGRVIKFSSAQANAVYTSLKDNAIAAKDEKTLAILKRLDESDIVYMINVNTRGEVGGTTSLDPLDHNTVNLDVVHAATENPAEDNAIMQTMLGDELATGFQFDQEDKFAFWIMDPSDPNPRSPSGKPRVQGYDGDDELETKETALRVLHNAGYTLNGELNKGMKTLSEKTLKTYSKSLGIMQKIGNSATPITDADKQAFIKKYPGISNDGSRELGKKRTGTQIMESNPSGQYYRGSPNSKTGKMDAKTYPVQ
jgi:hypothetical protein